ncbi:MAG: endonuclease V [Gemmataceae bacterium]
MAKICLDVDYREAAAMAAALVFEHWSDARPARALTRLVTGIEPYVPGQFYRRELPCLLAVLEQIFEPLETVVIDGYVWLEDESRPGLGAHLFQHFHGAIPIIGVAKTRFLASKNSVAVTRGDCSTKPLHVTAAGMSADRAAECIRSMHGGYRIPTLLREVDHLCRSAAGSLPGM